MSARPSVSVIVPFAGTAKAASSLLDGLQVLRLHAEDQLIVVDNSPAATVSPAQRADGPVVVRADREQSSYHARNLGAEHATGVWLLFMDADCRPDPNLIDLYFATEPDPNCALVAGGVLGDDSQRGLLPAWARSRRQLSQDHLIPGPSSLPHPAAGTPNLMIRRDVFEALGGFHEGIRSAGDVEICWRIQDAGWTMSYVPSAPVVHHYRRRLRSLASQSARHAMGHRWLSRRYPGSYTTPPVLRRLARAFGGSVIWTLSLQPRRALFKLIDGFAFLAGAWGWWMGINAVRPEVSPSGRPDRSLVVVTDAFPARSETFVYNELARLEALGWTLRVESLARPIRTERSVARAVRIDYLEDDAPREKLRDLIWLCLRHPLGCLRDTRNKARWSAEEEVWPLAAIAPAARRLIERGEGHLHAHFAAGGALVALRLSRITGTPYSLTAHAYDIFQHPRNLPEKLERATFAAAECDYTASHLRHLAPSAEVHRIATGVDGSRFMRSRPYPDGARVVAIGRLVEKKGFEHLIRAATMFDPGDVKEVVIAGEGPLGEELRELVAELGIGNLVRLLGPVWGPGAVRDLLETAALLVVPSVIAADGDRDALPLVAYEGLAMEVPVVASELVGLPELVRPPWGRLVEPGDPAALAEAIVEALSEPQAARAEAGAKGREFVLTERDPGREAARLSALLESARR